MFQGIRHPILIMKIVMMKEKIELENEFILKLNEF
jgi:hypothetical protein